MAKRIPIVSPAMLFAFLTTILWSISIVCANRSVKVLGPTEANFWRLTLATVFLGGWAFLCGQGASGPSFPHFLMSGIIGIGIGDIALFQALPRLGSRLTSLLMNCLSTLFGAIIEFFWLGTRLTSKQVLCDVVILTGIAIALIPSKNSQQPHRQIASGLFCSIIAALGNSVGAVLIRRGYGVAKASGFPIDAGTAGFQRLIGGLFLTAICLLFVKQTFAKTAPVFASWREKWKKAGPWVLANSLAGQTLGSMAYQMALRLAPVGVVLPINATAPLMAMPFAYFIEGDRPAKRAVLGGIIAVGGAVALALVTHF